MNQNTDCLLYTSVGLLLDFSGFKCTLTVQPDSAMNMLHIMYLIVPFALDLIITFIPVSYTHLGNRWNRALLHAQIDWQH